MADKIPEFYTKAIYNVFHDVIDIKFPTSRGRQNNLVFVKTSGGDYVAKFNTCDMVLKNRLVCQMARQNGILTPDISIAEYNNVWFEYYPMIPGKTLFERINNDNMPTQAIKHAFDEILVQFSYMDNLPINQIQSIKCSNIHQASYEHGKNANGSLMAHVIKGVVYMMNRGKSHNAGLYHCDITPKNVVVSEDGKLTSFLDIDSMTISNRSFAFSVFADKWVQTGFDINEMYDKYEYLTGRPINRKRINTMLNAVHAGKFIMFLTSKNKNK